MIQSSELINLIIQFYAAISSGEPSVPAQDLLSQENGFLALGSGPGEWWRDADVIIQGYQRRVATGGSEVRVSNIEAYQEGSVGWVVDRVTLKTHDGDHFPVRHTYILHQVEGKWKIIHAHYSLEITNEKF